MTDHTPFIQVIMEDPASESKRLVYADWLEEHNDPHAASYLRTEAELAKLPLDAPDAPALREALWQAWAAVDPNWLMTFTQPRMLRANPTPFPSDWKNFDLGNLRERQGTYGTWLYDSVPPLHLDELRGEFQYLRQSQPAERGDRGPRSHRQGFDRLVKEAVRKEARLPQVFLKFMNERVLQNGFFSATDCYFEFPSNDLPIRDSSAGDASHVTFYCDSQFCLIWDLYVHRSGAHCVIARSPDRFEEAAAALDAWFVAPSFEAFLFRVWLENQVWQIENADFMRGEGAALPKMTSAIQAYIDHYKSHGTKPAA